jgi:hypothetical protein
MTRGNASTPAPGLLRLKSGRLFLRLKSGRLVSFLEAHREARKARSVLCMWMNRALGLAPDEDPEITEHHLEWVEMELDRLAELMDYWRADLARRGGVRNQRQKVLKLRAMTVANGCTVAEARSAQARADALERK